MLKAPVFRSGIESPPVQSVNRHPEILRAVQRAGGPVTSAQIAREVGTSAACAQRSLRALRDSGELMSWVGFPRTGTNGCSGTAYYVAPEALALGRGMPSWLEPRGLPPFVARQVVRARDDDDESGE